MKTVFKTALLVTLTALPVTNVVAYKYSIITDDDGISGTLKTLPKTKLLNLVGDLPDYFETHAVEHTSGGGFSLMSLFTNNPSGEGVKQKTKTKKINPFRDATKQYMAVEVRITNNTDKTIVLDKDEYLRGVAKSYIPKEDILNFYTPFISYQKGERWGGIFMAAGSTVVGIPLGGASLLGLVAPLFIPKLFYAKNRHGNYFKNFQGNYVLTSDGQFWKRVFQEPTYWGAVIGTGITALGLLAAAGFGVYQAYKASGYIATANEKKEGLEDLTSAPADAEQFRIRPGGTLKDIFFIDLKKADRDVFERQSVELLYRKKAAKKRQRH